MRVHLRLPLLIAKRKYKKGIIGKSNYKGSPSTCINTRRFRYQIIVLKLCSLLCVLLGVFYLVQCIYLDRILRESKEFFTKNISKTVDGINSNEQMKKILMNYGSENRQFFHLPNLDCTRLFSNDTDYMEDIGNRRMNFPVGGNRDMHCTSIYNRVISRTINQSVNKSSIAFARIVYTDYEVIEDQLAATFSIDNHYCYAVDTNSWSTFSLKMKILSSCLPNVHITNQYSIDRYGKNMNKAHLGCIELLLKVGKWDYVILMQNHDMLLRTQNELDLIFQQMNGVNEIEVVPCPNHICNPLDREGYKYTARSLQLFKNVSEVSEWQLDFPITWAKGAVQSTVGREAAEWLIDKLNLTRIMQVIEEMNRIHYGYDEILLPTLHASEGLLMPGGFTSKCLQQRKVQLGWTRKVVWGTNCRSGRQRHFICVLGVEYLPELFSSPFILANKMMPSTDPVTIHCVNQMVYNRTHYQSNIASFSNIRQSIDNSLPMRFHNHRKNGGTVETFQC